MGFASDIVIVGFDHIQHLSQNARKLSGSMNVIVPQKTGLEFSYKKP